MPEMDNFVAALDEPEATDAQQVIDSWKYQGWIDELPPSIAKLSNREIIALDESIDKGADGVVEFVQFEGVTINAEGHRIVCYQTIVRSTSDQSPPADCLAYIFDRVGCFKFDSLDGLAMIRSVWASHYREMRVINYVIDGMLQDGLIRPVDDWNTGTNSKLYMVTTEERGERWV